jgi:hypothetical protein
MDLPASYADVTQYQDKKISTKNPGKTRQEKPDKPEKSEKRGMSNIPEKSGLSEKKKPDLSDLSCLLTDLHRKILSISLGC